MVESKFQTYPQRVKSKLNHLRQLIINTMAKEDEEKREMEECLKCGEPSYLVKMGSTIRIDWKSKTPDQYAIYFKCTTELIPTFKAIFGNTFKQEMNRAIMFDLDEPMNVVFQCYKQSILPPY